MVTLRAKVVTTILLSLGVVGCEGLLDVELPGAVIEEDLADVRVAETLALSVVGNTGVAWDEYVLWATAHSDEWTPASGNAPTKRMALRQIDPAFDHYVSNLFSPLHRARAEADEFFERIQTTPDAELPRKTEFLAKIRAWGSWPLIAFAETFCGTPIDGGSQILDSAELFGLAETGFTEAIQLAEQAGLSEITTMARVGRARARLGLEDYAGAIADAEMIPEGFLFVVDRDGSNGRLFNSQFVQLNGLPSDGETRKRGSVAPSYWDVRWKGVDDPRVNVTATGTTTFDFITEHYRHDKINSVADDVRLASWEEAQLFIAEAAAQTGDLTRAREILADLHQRAGIPAVTATDLPTQADVLRHVIEERRRELFAESGFRLRDHVRWRGTEFEIPFLGEPGSDAPDGRDIGGELYGSATCFPVPAIEIE